MATKITGTNNVTDPIAAHNAALAVAANATRKAPVARVPGDPAPATDITAQLAAMQAMMQQLMDTNAQLAAQNAELKAAKPAKAEKPAPTPENMSITQTGDELVIRVKLSKDTGKHTANGANLIVAQQNSAVGPYKFTYQGVEHWVSCMVARPEPNASELRKAYRAAKKGQ